MSAQNRQPRRIQGRGIIALFFILFLAFLTPFQSVIGRPPGPVKASSFSARLINLEATAKETFRFNATLFNGQNRSVIYELQAAAPPGWSSSFRVDGMQVTSIRLDSNKTQDISIELTPSPVVKPGKYGIPVKAISDQGTLELDLEAVVKGSYTLELTTPSGLLSDEVTEGKRKPISLSLKNQGTLPLDNLDLSAQTPSKWNVTFEPSKIGHLEPGSAVTVTANLNVPDKTIAGDYLTTFTANNANTNSSVSFRLTVTTSWLAGWLGVLIILMAIGIVYVLIRKYGRR